MSQISVNGSYWQTQQGTTDQVLLIPVSLNEMIPDNHPVRLLDEILLDGLDWTAWESQDLGHCASRRSPRDRIVAGDCPTHVGGVGAKNGARGQGRGG